MENIYLLTLPGGFSEEKRLGDKLCKMVAMKPLYHAPANDQRCQKSGSDFQLVTGCSFTVLWLKSKNSQRTTKEYTEN